MIWPVEWFYGRIRNIRFCFLKKETIFYFFSFCDKINYFVSSQKKFWSNFKQKFLSWTFLLFNAKLNRICFKMNFHEWFVRMKTNEGFIRRLIEQESLMYILLILAFGGDLLKPVCINKLPKKHVWVGDSVLLFFCVTNQLLWHISRGNNPINEISYTRCKK